MKEIILDSSLTVEESDFRVLSPQRAFGFGYKEFLPVTGISAIVTHRNYLDYLALCWKRHYGVVISPTILWNMVLNNLAFEVNKNPETYRKYFTESDEKQEIIVQQGGCLIDTKLLIEGLIGRIPSDIIIPCFLGYSTDTENAKIANYTAFLDMVSPYYNYGMLLCGIPKVRVLGTKGDWERFIDNCADIYEIIPEFEGYLGNIMMYINDIVENTCDYSKLFSLQRCGSGSQVEVSGWITEFFIEQPHVPYPENFISCIAKIDYKNYNEGGKEYRMYAGLFTSKIEDGYLIPAFDNMYFEKT